MAAGLNRPKPPCIFRVLMKKRHVALGSLVFLDAALKALAWVFLRHRDSAPPGAGSIRIGYVENASGFGFDQTRLLAHYGIPTDDAFVACSLIAFLILAAVILAWRKIGVRTWIKTAAAVLIYFAAATAAISLRGSIGLSLSPYLRGMLRALGPLAVAIALYSTVSRPYSAAMSLFFLAGTVGNCLSLILPPFAVIDYFGLYRTSIHGYVYANAADAYLLFAVLMILLVPVYLPVRSAIRSLRRRANSV